jgi:membrane associated rhomboid family serine protease
MVAMEQRPSLPPPPTDVEFCYRHPTVATAVHCTRCGRPICPDCMIPAPVGHHCPTCVAEARAEYRRGPGRRVAVANAKSVSVTSVLVAIIVAVYVIEIAAGGSASLFDGPPLQRLVDMGAAIGVFGRGTIVEGGIAAGQYWRLFTSMFLHANLIHIGLNSYALWIFGSMLEPEIGRSRFLIAYLVTGLGAGAASYAFLSPFVVGVGASGAIFGIFGIFLVYNYRRRSTPLGAARLRTGVVLLVINLVIGFSVPGIDWRAHVGGLVAGIVAGFAVDARGSASARRAAFVIGMCSIAAATVILVAWRTGQLHTRLGL